MANDIERVKIYILTKRFVLWINLPLIILMGWFKVMTGVPFWAGFIATVLALLDNELLNNQVKRGVYRRFMVYLSFLADFTIISFGLYFFGGAEHTWWFFPVFVIFTVGYVLDLKAALVYATFQILFVITLFTLLYFGLVPHYSIFGFTANYWKNVQFLSQYAFGMFLLYFAGAIISGYFNGVLAEANANLEEKVVERTRQLKETLEKLYRAEKLAAIGKLAGAIGHELRNPLGVIKNSAYFLNLKLQPSADDKIKKHLEIIEKEVGASTLIIEDILSFARIKMPEQKPVEIAPLIRESVESLPAPEGITVDIRPAEGLPRAFIDRAQIGQVFTNLIKNAYQAMPQGGRLTISTSLKGNFLEVAFADTGVGIPPENLPKLFEPLFTTKEKGTGFGLAIVASIVEGHKGKVEVESKIGEGTTFKILLPADLNLT
jgi:signal transduction histidine kinase